MTKRFMTLLVCCLFLGGCGNDSPPTTAGEGDGAASLSAPDEGVSTEAAALREMSIYYTALQEENWRKAWTHEYIWFLKHENQEDSQRLGNPELSTYLTAAFDYSDYVPCVANIMSNCRLEKIEPLEMRTSKGAPCLEFLVKTRKADGTVDHWEQSCVLLPLADGSKRWFIGLIDSINYRAEQNYNRK